MKKDKVLIAANLESFFIKFLIPQLKAFQDEGYEVHIAAKSENLEIPHCDKKFDVDFARGFNLEQNIRSYNQLKTILKNEQYDLIICHTPFGGAITRLANKNMGINKTKIIYMNHGFHFYKGAPLINWLIFYPVEKYLAKFTDKVITINLEDYEIAKKKFKTQVEYVPGVGLDISKFDFKFSMEQKEKYREELGLTKKDFVIIYPAEINHNKRQEWLIDTLKPLMLKDSHLKLLLPGKDSLNGKVQDYVTKIGLEDQIKFLGFRNDIPKLLKVSDLSVSSSMREGLPVNVMEAIYCGLPIVVTDCRGNRDLIINGKNGFIVEYNNKQSFCDKVKKCQQMTVKDRVKIQHMDAKVIKKYLLDNVIHNIMKIYK